MTEINIVNTLRLLSIEMVQNANSGHPGMPLGCAPMIYILIFKLMNHLIIKFADKLQKISIYTHSE